jgi:hypothetical protein
VSQVSSLSPGTTPEKKKEGGVLKKINGTSMSKLKEANNTTPYNTPHKIV